MKIGEKIIIKDHELMYICADTTYGEYGPSHLLVDLQTGRCYKIPDYIGNDEKGNFRLLTINEAVKLAKEDPKILKDITIYAAK
ncbi:MAG TPA: hypothetical protein VE912_23540 [Bacteroidales bacterium]|nr:hypothetical protein [Bacteroidales bacterium]